MISYKLITQDAYTNLQKNFLTQSSQKSLLLKASDDLREKIDLLKHQIQNSHVQLQSERQKNKQLRNHIRLFQTKIQQITVHVASFIPNQKFQIESFHDSSTTENNLQKHKVNLDLLCRILQKNIEALTEEYEIFKQKQRLFQENQELFLTTFNKLDTIIANLKQQKQKLILEIQQKQNSIQSLGSKLQKHTEIIQKLTDQLQIQKENCKKYKIANQKQIDQYNHLLQQNQISYEKQIQRYKCQIQQSKIKYEEQIQQRKQQIQQNKIKYERQIHQYNEQILNFKEQIQQFKKSPISQLKEKLKAKQAWIDELTKNINQLKQRCIHLQMENSKTNSPYTFKSTLRKEQAERTKYLMICKQMVQQFNLKLSKIQQQKKQMEERYKMIKLKLNDYQYKEFKYKDKIGLYLQKIEKYEILTQKQQSEMEKLILQFDEELNNVIRIKEQEAKSKFEEEIEKYQQAISKIKEEESNFKRNESQTDSRLLMKTQSLIDELTSPILNIQSQVQVKQRLERASNTPKELTKLKKQLQKVKKSKQSYKQKVIQLQKTCYNYSLEIRRYRSFIQQLYAEVQLKTNENQKLKNALYKNGLVYHSLINNNQTSAINSEGNISAIVNSENNGSGLKDRQSDLEYQISEIDTEIQKKNQRFLNQVLVNQYKSVKLFKYQEALDTASYPLNIPDQSGLQKNIKLGIDLSINESILSISKSLHSERSEIVSQVSLASSNPLNLSKNSPDNSFSSKNSYGIKSLYTEKSNQSQNENSLQAKSQYINQ